LIFIIVMTAYKHVNIAYFERLKPTNEIILSILSTAKQRPYLVNNINIKLYPVSRKEHNLLMKFRNEGNKMTFHSKN